MRRGDDPGDLSECAAAVAVNLEEEADRERGGGGEGDLEIEGVPVAEVVVEALADLISPPLPSPTVNSVGNSVGAFGKLLGFNAA